MNSSYPTFLNEIHSSSQEAASASKKLLLARASSELASFVKCYEEFIFKPFEGLSKKEKRKKKRRRKKANRTKQG